MDQKRKSAKERINELEDQISTLMKELKLQREEIEGLQKEQDANKRIAEVAGDRMNKAEEALQRERNGNGVEIKRLKNELDSSLGIISNMKREKKKILKGKESILKQLNETKDKLAALQLDSFREQKQS